MSGTTAITPRTDVGTPQPLPGGTGSHGPAAGPKPTRGIEGTSPWDGAPSDWVNHAVADRESRHAIDGSSVEGFLIGGALGGAAAGGFGVLVDNSHGRPALPIRRTAVTCAAVGAAVVGTLAGTITHWAHGRSLDDRTRSDGRTDHPSRELAIAKGVQPESDNGPKPLSRLVRLTGKDVDATLIQQGDTLLDTKHFDEALDDARRRMAESVQHPGGVVGYAVVRDDGGFLRGSKSYVVALTPAPGTRTIGATTAVRPQAMADGVQAVVTDTATYLRTEG